MRKNQDWTNICILIFLFLKATFSKFLNFFFFLKKVITVPHSPGKPQSSKRVFHNPLTINTLCNHRQSFSTRLQSFNMLTISNLHATQNHATPRDTTQNHPTWRGTHSSQVPVCASRLSFDSKRLSFAPKRQSAPQHHQSTPDTSNRAFPQTSLGRKARPPFTHPSATAPTALSPLPGHNYNTDFPPEGNMTTKGNKEWKSLRNQVSNRVAYPIDRDSKVIWCNRNQQIQRKWNQECCEI